MNGLIAWIIHVLKNPCAHCKAAPAELGRPLCSTCSEATRDFVPPASK